MFTFNYFSILCFIWAFIGITSRFLIVYLGERWNKWELNNAYSKEKPKWIYIISLISVFLVIYTWYQVFITEVRYSWVIATLISLTLIKVSALIFNYDKFRAFAIEVLNNKSKLQQLNIGVLFFSIICIGMGLFLY